MVVAVEAPAQLTLTEKGSNGTNDTNGTNGTNGIMKTTFVPWPKKPTVTRIPPPKLVDPDTIAALAERFNLDNFINQHEVHQHELTTIEDIDTTMIRDKDFFRQMTHIDVKHNHAAHWGQVIKARESIATHLHIAHAESDHLLESLTEVIDHLDKSEHAKAVAIAKFKAAERRREEIEKQLKIANCQLGQARFRMIELAQERDAKEARAEVAEKVVLIRDKQIETFRIEIKKLKEWAVKLTAQRADAIEACRRAREAERIACAEAEAARVRADELEVEKTRLETLNIELEQKYTEISMEKSDLERKLLVQTTLLHEAEGGIVELTSMNGDLQDQVKILNSELIRAEEDKDVLNGINASLETRCGRAIEDRRKAECARDTAIQNEMESKRLFANVHILWEDAKSALEFKESEIEDIKHERNHARERAFNACHFVQESIEWGQSLNLINHQLLREWKVMKEEKICALREKLDCEKEKFHLEGHKGYDHKIILELETKLRMESDCAQKLEKECEFKDKELKETKEKMQSELNRKIDELANAQIDAFKWDKERSELTKSLDMAEAKNVELKTQHETEETILRKEMEKLELRIKESEAARAAHELAVKQEAQKMAAEKEALDAKLRRAEEAILSREYEHLCIHDVFYDNKRLEDHEDLDDSIRKKIYDGIAALWGTTDKFQLDEFFPDTHKKKPVQVICRFNKGDKPVRVFDNSEGFFKFPSRK